MRVVRDMPAEQNRRWPYHKRTQRSQMRSLSKHLQRIQLYQFDESFQIEVNWPERLRTNKERIYQELKNNAKDIDKSKLVSELSEAFADGLKKSNGNAPGKNFSLAFHTVPPMSWSLKSLEKSYKVQKSVDSWKILQSLAKSCKTLQFCI